MELSLCERLWREYADKLLIYATSLLKNSSAAEDVLQAVFARLVTANIDFESEEGYLFRAVRNEALNSMRSARRFKSVHRPMFEVGSPSDEAELGELRVRVEAVLQELPDEQREAVVLKIWGNFTFDEAAAVVGITAKTLEHRYYRGMSALESKLGNV